MTRFYNISYAIAIVATLENTFHSGRPIEMFICSSLNCWILSSRINCQHTRQFLLPHSFI